jgi:hypothetical protein
MRTKITKIDIAQNPVVPTANKEDYVCGREQDTEVSPFIDYYVIGTLERPIEVGKGIRMLREDRNGVKAFGMFTSSVVKAVKGGNSAGTKWIVETDNSVYRVEDVE